MPLPLYLRYVRTPYWCNMPARALTQFSWVSSIVNIIALRRFRLFCTSFEITTSGLLYYSTEYFNWRTSPPGAIQKLLNTARCTHHISFWLFIIIRPHANEYTPISWAYHMFVLFHASPLCYPISIGSDFSWFSFCIFLGKRCYFGSPFKDAPAFTLKNGGMIPATQSHSVGAVSNASYAIG
jgi:hypothetical protein